MGEVQNPELVLSLKTSAPGDLHGACRRCHRFGGGGPGPALPVHADPRVQDVSAKDLDPSLTESRPLVCETHVMLRPPCARARWLAAGLCVTGCPGGSLPLLLTLPPHRRQLPIHSDRELGGEPVGHQGACDCSKKLSAEVLTGSLRLLCRAPHIGVSVPMWVCLPSSSLLNPTRRARRQKGKT